MELEENQVTAITVITKKKGNYNSSNILSTPT
jgi:hypothetical protein